MESLFIKFYSHSPQKAAKELLPETFLRNKMYKTAESFLKGRKEGGRKDPWHVTPEPGGATSLTILHCDELIGRRAKQNWQP
jgi:hypothetical protein